MCNLTFWSPIATCVFLIRVVGVVVVVVVVVVEFSKY